MISDLKCKLSSLYKSVAFLAVFPPTCVCAFQLDVHCDKLPLKLVVAAQRGGGGGGGGTMPTSVRACPHALVCVCVCQPAAFRHHRQYGATSVKLQYL